MLIIVAAVAIPVIAAMRHSGRGDGSRSNSQPKG
jgi:hypothetical protein